MDSKIDCISFKTGEVCDKKMSLKDPFFTTLVLCFNWKKSEH